MTATFASTLASAGTLCALALLVGLSLVLKGLALQPRALPSRLVLGGASLALVVIAFVAAGGWMDRAVLLGFGLVFAPLLYGIVVIRENQVGVVVKKFARRNLPPGEFIALHGEAGYQADTLPPGLHFGYGFWQFRVAKVPVVIVPPGETLDRAQLLLRIEQLEKLAPPAAPRRIAAHEPAPGPSRGVCPPAGRRDGGDRACGGAGRPRTL